LALFAPKPQQCCRVHCPRVVGTTWPRCTPKSPPLGMPPSTVLCTSRALHLYSKLHLHPAPESRYSPHVVSKRVAALQPLQAPVHPAPRAHRPKVSSLLHQHGKHATSTSGNACGDQRRNRAPRSEAQKRGRIAAGINEWRTLVASRTNDLRTLGQSVYKNLPTSLSLATAALRLRAQLGGGLAVYGEK